MKHIVAIILGFCTLLVGTVLVLQYQKPKMTRDEADRLIASELPVGSSQIRVMAFLNHHKIVHSGMLEHPESESYYFGNPKLEGQRDKIKSYISAQIPNIKWYPATTWNIEIRFYLDEQGRMVNYLVVLTSTGL